MAKPFWKREKPGPKRDQETVKEEQQEIQADEVLDELVKSLEELGKEPQEIAAHVLGEGYRCADAAKAAGVNIRTIFNWKHEPEFMQLVDTVTLTTGIADKGERIREAKAIVRELKAWRREKGKAVSEKDVLDWLKYIRDEQEGLRLFSDVQLEQFANAIVNAGTGSAVDATGGQGEADGVGGAEAGSDEVEG